MVKETLGQTILVTGTGSTRGTECRPGHRLQGRVQSTPLQRTRVGRIEIFTTAEGRVFFFINLSFLLCFVTENLTYRTEWILYVSVVGLLMIFTIYLSMVTTLISFVNVF